MKKLALAAALVLPPAFAAQAFGTPEEPRPLVVTLENGLRVVAKEARGTGLVAVACFVDGGNRTEPAELSGLSHYYEHLVFRGGTAKQKELETRKVFTQLGTFYGYTTEDSTCFYVVVPKASLDEALWRHVDAVTKVEVTKEKVDKEREVVLSEYKMRVADSPSGALYHELFRTAFQHHPYGRTTIGLREVIEGSDLARFRSFYEERYVANQIVIAAVGDLPAQELVQKIKDHWGGVPRGKASFELGVPEPAQDDVRTHVDERDAVTQSYLALAFRAPGSATDPRRVHQDVLSYVLSGGDSARLPRLLTARRIALSAGAWSPSCKDPGLFCVSMEAEPEKEARALEEAVSVLRALAERGPTDEELANAKRRLTSETIFAGESVKDDALRLGTWAIMGDAEVGTTYLDKVAKVSAADVQAAAKELFRAKNTTVGVVRPKDRPQPDWAKIVRGLDAPATSARRIEHSSGARLIIEEARRHKVVALEVRIAGGQLAEEPAQAGVAQLTERCLLRGTKRLDRASLARELDKLAVRYSTSSDRESTALSLRATDETFEPALALLAEALREPAFLESEVKSAREETLEAIASVEDDSFALTGQEFAKALYGSDHPYGRPVAGTKETVAKLSREDLARFHARVYRPENLVVSVVGAIDPARAEALVEKHLLGSASASGEGSRAKAPPQAPPARPGIVVLDRKREQATLDLGLVTVAANDPDWLPLQVAARHLGNELFFRYVYEQGVSYRTWTFLRSGQGPRPLVLETGITPKNFPSVHAGLLAAVSSLVQNGLTADEVARAKRDLENRYLLARETNEDRARSLAGYELVGLGFDFEDRLAERLALVTPEVVKKALERRVDPAKLTLVVVGDRAALEAAGAKLGTAPPEERKGDGGKREPD